MTASIEKYKNFNKTVKDGVKYIVLWTEHIEEDHQEILGNETSYQQTAEKDRQKRHKVLKLFKKLKIHNL